MASRASVATSRPVATEMTCSMLRWSPFSSTIPQDSSWKSRFQVSGARCLHAETWNLFQRQQNGVAVVSVNASFYFDGGGLRQRIRDAEPDGGHADASWS